MHVDIPTDGTVTQHTYIFSGTKVNKETDTSFLHNVR
jgi:hypothetical protein